MKVALIQLSAASDKAANTAKAAGMVKAALGKGAAFVLLPEIFNFRGNMRDTAALSSAAETIPGPTTKLFATLAKAHKAHILLGSILEKASGKKVYNTSVLLSVDGTIKAKYRKIHLFDAKIGDRIVREADCFYPGRRVATGRVGEFKIGLSICYDLRFADLYGKHRNSKVHVLTAPSCFTQKTGQAHWEVLLRARAIENLAYVLAPNQVGEDFRGMPAYGNSMIVAPWGEVIARGSSDKEEIVYGEISVDKIHEARNILPGIIK